MIKNISKLFLLATLSFFLPLTALPNTEQSQEHTEFMQIQRAMLEELLTEARGQANAIGNSVQQITQAIQYDKLKCEPKEKQFLLKELEVIQQIIEAILSSLSQININFINNALIHNAAISDYLLKKVKSNILTINIDELQDEIEKTFNDIDSNEKLEKLFEKTNKNIQQLLYQSNTIGLTWYNKTYSFLKKQHAGSIARHTLLATSTALGMYCAYKMIFQSHEQKSTPISENDLRWYHSFIGNPKYIHTSTSDINVYECEKDAWKLIPNKEIKTATGLYKIDQLIDRLVGQPGMKSFDEYGNAVSVTESTGLHRFGFLSGIISNYLFNKLVEDTKPYETLKSFYKPWWINSKLLISKKINWVEEALQGFPNKKLLFGEYRRVSFHDMTGAEHLDELAKKIANFMKNPERYERAQIEEHRGILLYGPPQTGKTLFANALRTLIQDEFGDGKTMHFIDAKALMEIHNYTVEYCFYLAKMNAPCILFFDEIDLIGAHREKSPISTGQLLTGMQGIDMDSQQVLVIGATNKPEQIDNALLVDGRFGKKIYIDYPKYQERKLYLEQQLAKRSLRLDPVFVDHIAQETEGCSYNNLKRIVHEAILLSDFEMQPVSQHHFEKVFDTEIRKIQSAKLMSDKEKQIVATYQAGKALMRHLLQTKNEVVKVTINPVVKNIKVMDLIAIKTDKDSENDKIAEHQKDQKIKYGEVFTKCDTDYLDLAQDKQQEHECMALLAGSVALQMHFNDSFTNCNPQDRAEAMKIIYNLITHGEKIDHKTKAQALNRKKLYEQKVQQILENNQDLLEKIVNALLEHNTLDRYQWADIIKN